MDSLLPYNATPHERALEVVLRDCVGTLGDAANLILSCKENPTEDWLLWLVWEYGLEELLPYIPDLRQLIIEGIPWQRIRGTPASVKQALGWIGSPDGAYIEEEETDSVHWNEFQMDSGFVPNGPFNTKQIVDIAKISAPIGTKLTRIFHGYDIRRFKLDYSDWGDLLSDYSGYKDPDLGVVLSFGRYTPVIASAEDDGVSSAVFSHTRSHSSRVVYEDRLLFGYSPIFGETHQPVHESTVTQITTIFGGEIINDSWINETWPDVPWNQYGTPVFVGQIPEQQTPSIVHTMPKAGVFLSDGEPFGDTNATFFVRERVEIGGPIVLSSGDALSGTPWRFEYRPIDERFERASSSAIEYDSGSVVIESVHIRVHGMSADRVMPEQTYWQDLPWVSATWVDYQQEVEAKIYSTSVVLIERTSFTQPYSQNWQPVTWGADSWRDTEIIVRTNHYGDSA